MKHCWILISLLFFFPSLLISQSPYETNWKKEIPFLASGISSVGLSVYLASQNQGLNITEIESLNSNSINSFDRFATENFSLQAKQNSDVFLIGSQFTPLLFLSHQKSRAHFGQIMTLYGEAVSINLGLTFIAKYVSRRNRPFVYNPSVDLSLKLDPGARTSFWSGHASSTAVNSFFAAKVFSDLYPNSKWKPVIWGAAATIPAITGYLRIKAGKHYPSDVIVGYITGAAIGILIPHLHRKKSGKKRNVNFQMGLDGALVRVVF